MQRWLALLLAALLAITVGGTPVQAQDGGELPPCTAEDLQPIATLAIGMIETMDRQGAIAVDNMLHWRERLIALDVEACDGIHDPLLQLQLASDELLIGTLLLERGEEHRDMAAAAINIGLTNLVGLRFSLAETINQPDMIRRPFGTLTGNSILAAFEAAGLPFDDVVRNAGPAGADSPTTETERITFALTSVFDGAAGQVLVFDDVDARDEWLAYLLAEETMNEDHVFTHQNVLLVLGADLDTETALQFREALETVAAD